jgi:hypothetical protein
MRLSAKSLKFQPFFFYYRRISMAGNVNAHKNIAFFIIQQDQTCYPMQGFHSVAKIMGLD